MKATGILRRIDELGRVVIPKEIRKSMKMREGEELEIYTTEEEVVLRKYSEMSSLEKFSRTLAAAIYKVTGKAAIITDTDKIIAAAGKGVPEEGSAIPDALRHLLEERRRVTLGEGRCHTFGVEGVRSEIVQPILSAGDLFGAILLLSKEPVTKADEQLAATGASFFEEQIGR